MTGDRDRLERGRQLRARAQGEKHEAIREVGLGLDPDLPDMVDEFVFGTIWARPGLDFQERMLVAIGALAAQGKTNQLTNYLFGALQDGMPEAKVREAVMMAFVYGGFPNGTEAITCWADVRKRAAARGYLKSGVV